MKGDVIIVEEHHKKAAALIVSSLKNKIIRSAGRYIITVAGESGSGKSETARAIADELINSGINAVVFGQDDYFRLPPKANDAKRREDPEWLGPHVEVNLDLLEDNISDAVKGKNKVVKPLIDYNSNTVGSENIDLENIKVVIAEGTYTSLIKNADSRVFIARNRLDTLEHRRKRNRGGEAFDEFIENVLRTEHKIIAGHIQLADFVVTKNYDIIERNSA